MLELAGDLDFAAEPVDAEEQRQLGLRNLDRDGTVELAIVGPIHRRHAPATQLAFEPVAVAEHLLERREQIGHEPSRLYGSVRQAYGPDDEAASAGWAVKQSSSQAVKREPA
ncbi:MAG TPA: hypothetical protein VGI92_05320 [Gemmatimonadales bacterium]|jgi:hypothetical protein